MCVLPVAPVAERYACLQETILETVADWAQDSTLQRNDTILLVVGLIYAAEQNYVEALRACSRGNSLEV